MTLTVVIPEPRMCPCGAILNTRRELCPECLTRARSRRYGLSRFGLTEEEYEALLADQDGVCAICHRTCSTGRRLAVDHDHATGVVRGLLCQGCNTGIGKLGEDPGRLRAAADYLTS